MKDVIRAIEEWVNIECMNNPESLAPVWAMGVKAFLLAVDAE